MGRYNYTQALGKLIQWAHKEGYEITLDHNDISYINWLPSTLNKPFSIRIEGKYPIEIKFYILLHELGHHILRKDWDEFTRVLPISAYAEHVHFFLNDSKYKRRIQYNVSCMEEEFKAWAEGYKLGVALGLRINDKKWHDLKSKCLIAYMRYYSTKKT
jgi:hypothetical protein